MAYRLSERHTQNKSRFKRMQNPETGVDFNTLASVCIVFGLLSLVTAWFFTFDIDQGQQKVVQPTSAGQTFELGPIVTKKYKEVFKVEVNANIPIQSWSFIEGQLVDAQRQYIVGFGEELWREAGIDSDGRWEEADDNYTMHITIPKPGSYYLQFNVEGNQLPNQLKFQIVKIRGSSIPHLWFGIILIIAGIVLNEIRNRTISQMVSRIQEHE